MKINIFKSIFHFLMALSFFVLLVTAISADILFSKEAIMESFSFSFAQVGTIMNPVDQLYVARLLRRTTWGYHYIAGIGLFSFYILFNILLIRVNKKKSFSVFNIVLGIQIFVMFILGILLQYRYLKWFKDSHYIDIIREIHHIGAYLIVITIIYHLITVYRTHKGFGNDK